MKVEWNKEKGTIEVTVPYSANRSLVFAMTDTEAWNLMAALFGEFKKEDIRVLFMNKEISATDEEIDKIAEKLFDEIHKDELYFELEDKNILYLYDEIKEEGGENAE